MKENNIYNHYNRNTELSVPEISFKEDELENKEKEIQLNKEEIKTLLELIFLPNINKLDFKGNIFLYIVLGVFSFITIIDLFINKVFGNLLAILLLIYITIIVSSKLIKLENTRYINIATWNLYNSLTMLIKALMPEFIKKINYAKFISCSSIIYILTLVVGIVPSFEFLSFISLILLISSYITAFYYKDFEIIKESLKILAKLSPVIISIGGILGGLFYGSDAINIVGYISWLIIYSIDVATREYIFKEV